MTDLVLIALRRTARQLEQCEITRNDLVRDAIRNGAPVADIAAAAGLGPATIYRWRKWLEEQDDEVIQ